MSVPVTAHSASVSSCDGTVAGGRMFASPQALSAAATRRASPERGKCK